MRISFITPIKHLELSKKGDLYILASDLYRSEEFQRYVKKSKQFKLGDLNVHEQDNTITWQDYVELAIDYNFNAIVIPDVLENYEQTLKNYYLFKQKYKNVLKGMDIMAAVQGKTLAEIEKQVRIFDKDKFVNTISLSFTLVPFQFHEQKYINQSLNRLFLVNHIINNVEIKSKIHLLGSNNLYELLMLKHYKQICSTDGKLALRYAVNNLLIDKERVIKPPKKLYMNSILNEKQLSLAKKNIDIMNKLLK